MSNILKKYKLTVAIILSSVTILFIKYDHKYDPKYEILSEDNEAYGSYKNGLIYIGTQEFINNLSNINDNDILIVTDKRKDDMMIESSYKIIDKDLRNDILCVLKNYKDNNDILWNRSLESMRVEWFIHNLLYYCNFETSRTKDVDFQNSEEKIYNKKILNKIFKL